MSNVNQGVVLGIDLGTSLSVMAILAADGKPQIIRNMDGDLLTPSVVNLRDEQNPVVGRAAVNQAAIAPEFTVRHFKRFMGINDKNGQPQPVLVHPTSGRNYSAIDCSAIVLGYLARSAEKALGRPVAAVVITVPAYFDSEAREATRRAGEQAGLRVLPMINEPTAAGLAFGLEKGADGLHLVFDLGGGTFDVSIIDIHKDDFVVKATDGNRNVGGSDFDNLLLKNASRTFAAQHGVEITPETDLPTFLDALEKCENAKKTLSQAQSANFVLAFEGKRLIVDVTREQFETLIAPIVAQTREITLQAMKAAGVEVRDLRDVLLVGGSTRIPKFQAMLTDVFGKAPRTDTEPDEAVALGAAIYGAKLGCEAGITVVDGEGQRVLPPDSTVIDVTSHSLGCIALANGVLRNCVIIPANTQLPAERKDSFGLLHATQTTAEVSVTTGPDGVPEAECKVHGKLLLNGLPPRAVGVPSIEVTYGFTVEGTLSVTIKDLISGKTRHDLVPITG